jgi:hypothetical protein
VVNDLSGSASNFVHRNQAAIDAFTHPRPPLLSNSKADFNEYVELVRSRFLHVSVNYCDSTYAQAVRLMTTLKTVYDLGEEN